MLKHVLLIVTMGLFIGCASTKTTRVGQFANLEPQEGLVALEVINNTGSLTRDIRQWDEVVVIRVDNIEQIRTEAIAFAKKMHAKKKSVLEFDENTVMWDPEVYQLQPLPTGTLSTQVFFGKMPAGRYIIRRFSGSFSNSNYQAWFTKPVEEMGGFFSVKPKTLSDLGAMVYQPMGSAHEEGTSYSYVARLPRVHQLSDFVQDAYPKLAAQLTGTSFSGWDTHFLDHFRQDLGEMSRQNPYMTKTLSSDSQGSGALVGKLGQIKRVQQGKWYSDAVPSNAEVTSMLQLDTLQLVGTEQGGVYLKTNAAASWQSLSPIAMTESVIGLVHNGQSFFALTKEDKAFKIYRFAQPTASWELLKRMEIPRSAPLPIMLVTPAGLNVYAHYAVHRYDLSSNQWRSERMNTLSKIIAVGEGKWLAIEIDAGHTFYTPDYGVTWINTHRPQALLLGSMAHEYKLPTIQGDRLISIEGFADPADSSLVPKILIRVASRPMSLVMTGENTPWQQHGLVKEGCAELLAAISTQEKLYARCENGSIVSSSTMGRVWENEIRVDLTKLLQQYEQFVDDLKADNASKP
ncbi:MAG TPA: hypothetical protein DCS87_13235 [Rheinheimera sp.]|nr:hypothetical protein [Rheinheimera sp.]